MKSIPLSKGMVAFVSDKDFERVNQFKWCASEQGARGHTRHYAIRVVKKDPLKKWRGNARKIWMHRFIMEPSSTQIVHHKDNDGLMNTRDNLEILKDNLENMEQSQGWKQHQYESIDPFLQALMDTE